MITMGIVICERNGVSETIVPPFGGIPLHSGKLGTHDGISLCILRDDHLERARNVPELVLIFKPA